MAWSGRFSSETWPQATQGRLVFRGSTRMRRPPLRNSLFEKGEEYPPPLRQEGAVESGFLPDMSSRVFRGSPGAFGHVPDFQILDEDFGLGFTDCGRGLVEKIQAQVRDPLIGSRHPELLLPEVAALRPLPELPGDFFCSRRSLSSARSMEATSSGEGGILVPSERMANDTTPRSSPITEPVLDSGSGTSRSVWRETDHRPAFRVTVAFLRSPEGLRETRSLTHPTLGRKIRGWYE